MVFRTFDRTLFVALETAEGTCPWGSTADDATALAAVPTATDYVECIEPTFSITNREYDRNPTRKSITPVPKTVTGRGKAAGQASAAVEFSFSVELAGGGLTGTACVDPRWGRLLKCCGMEQRTLSSSLLTGELARVAGDSAPAPFQFRNREALSAKGSGTAYDNAEFIGRCFGGVSAKDGVMFYDTTSAAAAVAASDFIFGQATDVWAGTSINQGIKGTAKSGTPLQTNTSIGWIPTSGSALGGSNNTSCSIALYLSSSDQYIVATGCRGNVEFVFTSGDRVLMNFTMTGKMFLYGDSALAASPSTTGVSQPPGFVNTNLSVLESSYIGGTGSSHTSEIPYTGTIFNALSINLGNEVTIRENVSASTGYDVSYITGRSSSMTFNPDAKVQSTSYDFWERFTSGEQTRMDYTVGSEAGNKFMFRMPYMQFSGIADGNRDEVMVYDSTTTLTGGDMGESIQQNFGDAESATLASGSNILDPRLGTNNEFNFILMGNTATS